MGDVDGNGIDQMDVVIGARENTNEIGHMWLLLDGFTGANHNVGGASDGDEFSFAVAAGDVNDDGTYDDVIIAAPGYDAGAGDGAVFVYYGSASFDTAVDLSIFSSVDERFGFSLAKGDLNDDGYDDLAVGAPYYHDGDGAVYIYFGSSSGISDHSPPGLIYHAENDGELFGWNVTAGDFNGDGYDDLLVGAPSNDEVFTNGGRAYVFYGGDGTDMDGDGVDVDIESETDGAQFGWSVAAGNVDGSTDDDAIVGAPTYDTDKGRVYV